jgi:hypothetical protein
VLTAFVAYQFSNNVDAAHTSLSVTAFESAVVIRGIISTGRPPSLPPSAARERSHIYALAAAGKVKKLELIPRPLVPGNSHCNHRQLHTAWSVKR